MFKANFIRGCCWRQATLAHAAPICNEYDLLIRRSMLLQTIQYEEKSPTRSRTLTHEFQFLESLPIRLIWWNLKAAPGTTAWSSVSQNESVEVCSFSAPIRSRKLWTPMVPISMEPPRELL